MTSPGDTPADRLSLTVDAKLVPLFFQLLGHGFYLSVQTGCSVKELLCDQLGIHEAYLDRRIKTIFLNGKVVDDVTSANVQADATMALSGAMPGLVGAILRSGGFYAPMRRQISHEKNIPAAGLKKGKITLKLWNLVVKELGPTFLQRGVWVQGTEMRAFIERHWQALQTGITGVQINEETIEVQGLETAVWQANLIFLQVKSDQAA